MGPICISTIKASECISKESFRIESCLTYNGQHSEAVTEAAKFAAVNARAVL
jgi:hypothetical protein